MGHLFQGRFDSTLVDDNNYLKELIRYVHLNPVRAKIVDDPSEYRWSSHQAYLMQQDFTWLSKEIALQIFGNSKSEAVQAFENFVHAGVGLDSDIDFSSGFSEGILGDDDYIREKQEEFENTENMQGMKIDLNTLVSVVTGRYEIDGKVLRKPGTERKLAHIRALLALLARDVAGVTLQDVADFCGRDGSSMSKAASRLEAKMHSSEEIRNEIDLLSAKLRDIKEMGEAFVGSGLTV